MWRSQHEETCAELGSAARYVAAAVRTELHAISVQLDELERLGFRLEARGDEPYDPAGMVYHEALIQTGRDVEDELRRQTEALREIHDMVDRFG